jgi:hypothetical protein
MILPYHDLLFPIANSDTLPIPASVLQLQSNLLRRPITSPHLSIHKLCFNVRRRSLRVPARHSGIQRDLLYAYSRKPASPDL